MRTPPTHAVAFRRRAVKPGRPYRDWFRRPVRYDYANYVAVRSDLVRTHYRLGGAGPFPNLFPGDTMSVYWTTR